jgi:1,4-dihydroxy-2-naphthoyl-CoA hydrolase
VRGVLTRTRGTVGRLCDVTEHFAIPPGTFVEYLGLDITEASADRVVAHWTAGPRHHQPFGLVHGGVHCSIVETLGSFGGQIWVTARDEKAYVVGVNNNTDFFRAVTEGELTSVGVPLHQGRLQQLWLIETHSDADGRLVARGQVRLQNLYPSPD